MKSIKLERQTAPFRRGIDYTHRVRYNWASQRVYGRVIDAMCGCGYGTVYLRRGADEVDAFDISFDAISHAGAWFSPPLEQTRVNYFPVSFEHFHNYIENDADCVVCLEAIEHVDGDKFLDCCRKWLKPDGKLILSTPNQKKLKFNKEQFPFHVRHYTNDELDAMLDRHGFKTKETIGQGKVDLTDFVDAKSRYILKIATIRP